jgi:hypothetical protein
MKLIFSLFLIAFASLPFLSQGSPIDDDYLSAGTIEARHKTAKEVFEDWLTKEEVKHPELDCLVHESVCSAGGWGAKADCPVSCNVGKVLEAEFKEAAHKVGDALGCFLDNWSCGKSYGLAAGCPPPCNTVSS